LGDTASTKPDLVSAKPKPVAESNPRVTTTATAFPGCGNSPQLAPR